MSMHPLCKEMIDAVIRTEGGFVDDPDDSGGATKYGITEEVARLSGYEGDMVDLPYIHAFTIYKERYWDIVRGDCIADICPDVAREVVDSSINCGTSAAVKWLQTALNVLNSRQVYYTDLVTDGRIGAKTLAALKAHVLHRNSGKVLVKILNCLQGAHYVNLAIKREKDEKFIYGWFKERVTL